MANINLQDIEKYFGQNYVVRKLNLNIHDGEFVVLLGPSGCGKTTTLRAIAGLEEIDRGDILIDGKAVQHLRAAERDIAFVFQFFALYPHLKRLRQHCLSAACERPGPKRHRRAGPRGGEERSASSSFSVASRRRCPEATCSGSPSAARWFADPRRC